jgi:predicted  nucleic acid-binding Zn-ribbon protein
MTDLEEQLGVLQNRVKKLTTSRDLLIRDAGAAERKLEEAQENLRALGIETKDMTSKQLQEKAEELEAELATKVAEITTKVEEGEALVAKYQAVRG